MLTENGRKNTAAKQPSSWGAICGFLISESYSKTAHETRRSSAPILIRAHIQLAGHDLANNHTFKLLSDLLKQEHIGII